MSDPTTTPVWRCECGQEVTRKMGAWWCPTHRDLRVVHPDPSSAPSEAGAQEADCPPSEKQLAERVRVLEEALRFYADHETWSNRDSDDECRPLAPLAYEDDGERARKALSGGGEQHDE